MFFFSCSPRTAPRLTRADDDGDLGMVHDILNSIRSQSLIKRHRNQVEVVTRHLGNEPLGTGQGPDTDRPAVQLSRAHDGTVEVHQSRSKGIDALVDLTVSLPAVVAVGLCCGVVGAVAQKVVVSILLHRCVSFIWRIRFLLLVAVGQWCVCEIKVEKWTSV